MNKNDFYKSIKIKFQIYKTERIITTPQSAEIMANEKNIIYLCANNYLSLANNKQIADSAIKTLQDGNYGILIRQKRFV